ncbi:MAG: sugar ABC transporter permease [Treponema sp.]|jgi:multiple sugar transport system permease protein|nr:sugar ABC transporter permease [Treponema sp.]
MAKVDSIERSQLKWGYIFIAPCIFGLVVFNFGPMLFSLVMSFMEWDMITAPKFFGAGNYAAMFKEPLFSKSLSVTLYYALLSVPLINISTFLIANLLNTGIKGISVFRTIFYIPSIVPAVAASALWMYIFDPMFGLLNSILTGIGLPPQAFIYSEGGVVPGLALMSAWAAGNTVVIYLAGLQGLSKELYEAADLDGASVPQRFFRITVPLMSPIIFFNVIMAIITSMQTFTQAYIMTNGGPNNASLFYSLLLYRTAFHFQRMGYASALSWVLFIIIAVFTLLMFRSSNRWVFYENKKD